MLRNLGRGRQYYLWFGSVQNGFLKSTAALKQRISRKLWLLDLSSWTQPISVYNIKKNYFVNTLFTYKKLNRTILTYSTKKTP